MSETTITGSTIIATIKTMSALGHVGQSIGQRVLKDQGVDEINPEQQYPYTLRSKIHEAAHRRFGDDALFAFGFLQMEAMNRGRFAPVLSQLDEFYAKNKNRLVSVDDSVAEQALEEIYLLHNEVTDSLLKKATEGPFKGYGCYSKKVKRLTYEMHAIQAAWLQHQANLRGSVFATLCRHIADSWKVTFVFDASKSTSGDEWSEYVYQVVFERQPTHKSLVEMRSEITSEVKENLLRAVLADSERQAERTENIANKLAKFLPPQIHDALFSGGYDTAITTRRKKLSIFFSDIKNFTSTSEGLQPEDLTKYLNEYFSEMTAIALNSGATIDKYIGDAMMVFFGDPESKGEREDARACVEMALLMQERMKELQMKWRNEGFADPFQVRMGINTGYCNVGNFGSEQRLTYTIIGGEVNVAQRLEANATADGILMSYETFAHVQDLVKVRELESIKMKGINREIKIFSVLSRFEEKMREGGNLDSRNYREPIPSEVEGFNKLEDLVKRVSDLEKRLEYLFKKIEEKI